MTKIQKNGNLSQPQTAGDSKGENTHAEYKVQEAIDFIYHMTEQTDNWEQIVEECFGQHIQKEHLIEACYYFDHIEPEEPDNKIADIHRIYDSKFNAGPESISPEISFNSTEEPLNEIIKSLSPMSHLDLVYGEDWEYQKIREEGNVNTNRFKINNINLSAAVTKHVFKQADVLGYGLGEHNFSYFVYNGKYWQEIKPKVLMNYLRRCAKKLGVKPERADTYDFVEKLKKNFVALNTLMPETKSLLLNLQNGTIEVENDVIHFREHRKDDYLFYCLEYDYDPNAKCDRWMKFLDQALPETDEEIVNGIPVQVKQKQRLLQESRAYVFVDLKLEKVLLNGGDGGNGDGD